MIIPDVNLLLYAYNQGSPLHNAARNWWAGLMSGDERIGVPWIVVAGFIRLITSRSMVIQPSTVEHAVETIEEWFSYPHVVPINPGAQHLSLFRQALQAAGVGGDLVTDAHIAALAMEYQAEVHSSDNDFRRFHGLRWRNPLEMNI